MDEMTIWQFSHFIFNLFLNSEIHAEPQLRTSERSHWQREGWSQNRPHSHQICATYKNDPGHNKEALKISKVQAEIHPFVHWEYADDMIGAFYA